MHPDISAPGTAQPVHLKIEMIGQPSGKEDPYSLTPPAAEQIFSIIWVTEGKFSLNDNWQTITDRQFIFCFRSDQPGKLYFDDSTRGIIISFTKHFLDMGELGFDFDYQPCLLQLFCKLEMVTLTGEWALELKDLINRILNEYKNVFLFKTEILNRYIKIFLIHISRYFEYDLKLVQRTRNRELVQKFMYALDRNYRQKKTVSYYAGLLFVTPNYLNVIIKRSTGYPASHHIRTRVVAEAKRMAVNTSSSMKEIAYCLGFEDTAHFSKFFKSTSGSNFSEFKKEMVTIAAS
ncbi:MAG TPA: helix-turn-helix domain-containing protein [Puia sp.]|nr:helix-turn-helix domain-containing protein [Puia sp.]